MRRGTGTVVTAAALLVGWIWLLAPVALGGETVYVTTHGVSMQPRFHSGDLAILRPAAKYRVGDIVAYHSTALRTVVMHRIVAIHRGQYTFKGDNNSWLDPAPVPADELIGKLRVRVPAGGTWFKRVTSPATLAALGFLLTAGSGTAATTRRKRRRRRGTMARHAARIRPASLPARLPAHLVARPLAMTAAVAAIGLALGAAAWSGPSVKDATVSTTPNRSITFSYTASVARTPAYDGTTVTSPDPIFRKLINTVRIQYAYRGSPGSVAVAATLATSSGWHSTIRLAPATAFITHKYTGAVTLNLGDLQSRAERAATATGIPVGQVAVAITATVRTPHLASFMPTLRLTLNPFQLALEDPSAKLTAVDSSTVRRHVTVARTIGLGRDHITIDQARRIATTLLVLALLSAIVLVWHARRDASDSEGANIRRRYSSLLVPVAPVPAPPGRPVVDVADFATLARLAQRYGLLVLHWTRSEVDTFLLHDESTTYRYRTNSTSDVQPAHQQEPDVAHSWANGNS